MGVVSSPLVDLVDVAAYWGGAVTCCAELIATFGESVRDRVEIGCFSTKTFPIRR